MPSNRSTSTKTTGSAKKAAPKKTPTKPKKAKFEDYTIGEVFAILNEGCSARLKYFRFGKDWEAAWEEAKKHSNDMTWLNGKFGNHSPEVPEALYKAVQPFLKSGSSKENVNKYYLNNLRQFLKPPAAPKGKDPKFVSFMTAIKAQVNANLKANGLA